MIQVFDVAKSYSESLDKIYGTDRHKGLSQISYWMTETPARKMGLPLIGAALALGSAAIYFARKERKPAEEIAIGDEERAAS